jgi:hypothetical protein
MSMFPIETPGSLLLLRVLHDDELLRSGPPLEMGRALLSMPLTQRPLERWVDLVGERAGDRVAGEVRVGMRYTATNPVELQLGRRARVGGIVVADSDVLNSTVLPCPGGSSPTLRATYGRIDGFVCQLPYKCARDPGANLESICGRLT